MWRVLLPYSMAHTFLLVYQLCRVGVGSGHWFIHLSLPIFPQHFSPCGYLAKALQSGCQRFIHSFHSFILLPFLSSSRDISLTFTALVVKERFVVLTNLSSEFHPGKTGTPNFTRIPP